jgi:hypothetical protein
MQARLHLSSATPQIRIRSTRAASVRVMASKNLHDFKSKTLEGVLGGGNACETDAPLALLQCRWRRPHHTPHPPPPPTPLRQASPLTLPA